MVINQVTWVNARHPIDGGVTTGDGRMLQTSGTPNLFYGNSSGFVASPSLAVGTWGVITAIVNGASSEIRTNLNAAVTGVMGGNTKEGFVIGCRETVESFANVEFGYLIWRSGADSTAIQNNIIRGLEAACGLTF